MPVTTRRRSRHNSGRVDSAVEKGLSGASRGSVHLAADSVCALREQQAGDALCAVREHRHAASAQQQSFLYTLQTQDGAESLVEEGKGDYSLLKALFYDIFLPIGYPHTVTNDYVAFQLWDTAQAFSSYLRGLLCTHAVLTGVGVGDAHATAAAATLTWLYRDGAGMLGSVLFACSQARDFGWEVKKWRLFADVINDVGMTLDLLAPRFPQHFLTLVCLGSVCRSLCHVAAGATRASLMTHFAKANNASDLQAREGIQETAVTLLGMLAGVFATRYLDGSVMGTWIAFSALTVFHVIANLCAVRALVLCSLNEQRFNLLVDDFLLDIQWTDDGVSVGRGRTPLLLPTPTDIARRERICTVPSLPHFFRRYLPFPSVWCYRLGVPLHSLSFSAARFNQYLQLFTQLPTAPAVSEKAQSNTSGAPLFLIVPNLGHGVYYIPLSSACRPQHLPFVLFLLRVLHNLPSPRDPPAHLLVFPGNRAWPGPAEIARTLHKSPDSQPRLFPTFAHALSRAYRLALQLFSHWVAGAQQAGWDCAQLTVHVSDWRCDLQDVHVKKSD